MANTAALVAEKATVFTWRHARDSTEGHTGRHPKRIWIHLNIPDAPKLCEACKPTASILQLRFLLYRVKFFYECPRPADVGALGMGGGSL